MGRIGVRDEEALRRVLAAIENAPHVKLTGAFTHFADADGETDAYSRMQLERFNGFRALLPKGILIHAAASAAGARYPAARFDMVREGIALYGCAPVPEAPELKPALSWHTEIVYVKDLPAGACVSYGCTYKAEKDMRVATLPVGYGDGYHRALSGKASVLIGGQRCPVVGRVCMDQIMIDVSDIPDVKVGDEVTLICREGENAISMEEVAAPAASFNYELCCNIARRVPRVYYENGQAVECVNYLV
jgi:alanine racemase